MYRFLGFIVLASLLIVPLGARAQVPVPTPTLNPQSYNDLGMHFTAPPAFHALFQRAKIKAADLTEEPTVMAAWATYAQRPHRLLLVQQAFEGNLDGWDSTYTQTMRNQGESTMIKNHQMISLKNGMPAVYMEMTTGTGFDVTKGYIVAWADGQRGVALVLTGQVGEIDEKAAKAILLGDASAVRYPLDREQDTP